MNNPSPDQTPAKAVLAPQETSGVSPKTRIALGAEKQHNRDVGHFLKSAGKHRPMIARSLPHSRGR